VRLRVIGIGTSHGDDAAGLLAAERLTRARLPPGAEVLRCERPALDLLDALAEADAALVIDAMRSGAPTGHVRRLDPGHLAAASPFSSHGLGVAQTLALARALDRLPPRLAILGIEAGEPASTPAGLPSPAVRRAAARAALLAPSILEKLAR